MESGQERHRGTERERERETEGGRGHGVRSSGMAQEAEGVEVEGGRARTHQPEELGELL